MDVRKIEDVEIDGIDYRDYPDFCDAFLASATYQGRQLTEKELEDIQDSNPDWFYEQIENAIY